MRSVMEHPNIVLGVEMMDQDHLRIEKMFEAASLAPDEDLPVLYRDIAKELAAHFRARRGFPSGKAVSRTELSPRAAQCSPRGNGPRRASEVCRRGVATAHAFCHATIGFVACNDDGSNGGGFS